ncbi:MAG: hypothetical protein JW841_17315 [Deltaproteobacteria bacterium]|nr:hypothetical protein [Deltaproteobacteria bacterium]
MNKVLLIIPFIFGFSFWLSACGNNKKIEDTSITDPNNENGNESGKQTGNESENQTENESGNICVSGKTRCENNKIETCDGTNWSVTNDCTASQKKCSNDAITCESVSCDTDFNSDNACGGELTGTWHLADICVNTDELAALFSQATCIVKINNVVVSDITGTAVFSGTTVQRTVNATAQVQVTYPLSCFPSYQCVYFGLLIDTFINTAAATTCSEDSSGCNCTITLAFNENSDATYATLNGTMTINEKSTYYYCVDGWQVSFRQYGNNADESSFTQVYVR